MGRDCRGRCGRAPATRQGWSRQWQGTAGTGWESTRGRTPSATAPWPVRSSVALPFPPGPLSLGSQETLLQPSLVPVQAKIEQRAANTFVTDLVFGDPSRRSRRSNHWDPHARASRTNFQSRLAVNTSARLDGITRTHLCVTATAARPSNFPNSESSSAWHTHRTIGDGGDG